MEPLVGLALRQPEQPPVDELQRVCLEVGQEEEEPILSRRQGAGRIGGVAPGAAGLPVEAPLGHVRLKGLLKGPEHDRKLLAR